MDTEGIISVLDWSACDHERRRRFVAVKSEKTTLVAFGKQSAMGTKTKNQERSSGGSFKKRSSRRSGTWKMISLEEID